MSNGSGQDPEGDTTHATNDGEDPKMEGRPPVLLKNLQSLERLRDRVKQAARELERLRQENAALAERLHRLETRPDVDLDGTVLAFDTDTDALRDQVEGFIETIDAYLAKEEGG